MSSNFCSENTETITTTNYIDSYFEVNDVSCLPNSGTGFTVTTSSSLPTLVNSHVSGTLLTTLPAMSDSRYGVAIRDLINSIKTEYCFYYKRYMFALNKVLTLAATDDTPMESGSTYDSYKQNAKRLNTLLTEIVLILEKVSLLSGSPLDIHSVHGELISHMRTLKNNEMEINAKSAMIDYTLEKNSSSRNLLAIYGFMNIVAIGMLVYVYRAT